MLEIVSAGFGGQGVLTLGLIISEISSANGKNITWIPSYGSEMRGGTANCNVKISDGEIASPFVKNIDVLIAMNAPSVDKFEPMLKPSGTLILNSSLIKDYKHRDDINIMEIPATDISVELDNPKGANIVMLGAFAKITNLLEKDVFKNGMNDYFLEKGIKNDINNECFDRGYLEISK